jgi:hypothetical protein
MKANVGFKVEIDFAANEPFFANLVHYESKSGILSGNRFCCKRTVFATLVHYGRKSGIGGYCDTCRAVDGS